MPYPAQSVLPRWRGFNLLEMFTAASPGEFVEDDFRWISDWGFEFVRFPLSYHWWSSPSDMTSVREDGLARLDRGVDLARKYNLHLSINLHRAPGYCVGGDPEPANLWKDQAALDAFCFHWDLLARRYRPLPYDLLSFNLVNEPAAPSDDRMSRADHERVIRAAVAAIRKSDPHRLIIADGLSWGNDPSPELAPLRVAQSCRGYAPMTLTHYQASWVKSEGWPLPKWPGQPCRDELWRRTRLELHYDPWVEIAREDVGVHCGECGCYNKTPHDVVLRWLRDVLDLLTGQGIGYALWNFRGSFGILDSDRADVNYEDWHGRKLDRKLLDLLLEF